AQCHNALAGRRLGGAVIPQAHPTGYPLYRLEWQAVGSLERRIRNCNVGVRATPLSVDSDEMKALVGYLAHRARGMPLEGMAVRP
ncbi:MAG: sulfur oxidation c-type cytochrome SoxA, partial [Betaproteobacteria bacterium]|nr:sulfur oxidation c-type cytochrome SoxA [Betaproteobacteria bacterium]